MNKLQKDIEITWFSWLKTKAFTKYFFSINSEEDIYYLPEIIDFCKKNKLNFFFLGDWTNVFFDFYVFSWIIIKNNLKWWSFDSNYILQAYSGENISSIAYQIRKNYKLNKCYRFIGLPWSVWWAVVGNAWCFWLEISNIFLKARVFDIKTKNIRTFDHKNLLFKYRNSSLKNNEKYFVVDCYFDIATNKEKYSSNIDVFNFRKNHQPQWNSCWSFFKNPSREVSAGRLLEDAEFKGYEYNTAFFSSKHANFLMTNTNNANYKDVEHLIQKATNKIKKQFWYSLINEVNILTNKSQ